MNSTNMFCFIIRYLHWFIFVVRSRYIYDCTKLGTILKLCMYILALILGVYRGLRYLCNYRVV